MWKPTTSVYSEELSISDAAELDSLITIVETCNTQLAPSPFTSSIRRLLIGKTQVEGNSNRFTVRGKGAPHRGHVALAIVDKSADTRFNHALLEQGDILFCGEGVDFEILAKEGFEWFGLSIPIETFKDHLQSCFNTDSEQHLDRGLFVRAPAATMSLRRWWRDFRLFPNMDELRLVEVFLEVLCSNLDLEVQELSLSIGRRRAVALEAEEFLQAHLNQRLSIPELCRTLGVSRRTLELSFIETFGISPARYFRFLKLLAARRLLKKQPAEWGRVTTLTYDLGFSKLSDFSAAYRELFGESPSETHSEKHRPGRVS